jgi:ATP-binding cassette subfamily B (MDR/TAP) protein 1
MLSAIGCGTGFPLMFQLFGTVTTVFTDYQNPFLQISEEARNDALWDGVVDFAIKLCGLGVGLWVGHYVFVTCLNIAAERQVLRIRKLFLAAMLRQDISWYDTNTVNDFASTMAEDLNKIQDGLGEKIGMFWRFFITFLVAFVIAFVNNWELSLVLCAVVPAIAILGGVFGKIITSFSKNEMDIYGKAGALADEVLSSIRTVVAFGGQDKEALQYSEHIAYARSQGIKRGIMVNLTMGLMFGLMYCVYGLGFWYGVKIITDDEKKSSTQECIANCAQDPTDFSSCYSSCFRFDAGTISTALFGILQGGMQIGQSSMFVEAFNTARAAAGKIFMIIDRVPKIDASSEYGQKPSQLLGNIQFSGINFSYPSRPDVQILNNLNITIPSGKSVALVGSSGCGKSTCIQLIQRFYDPEMGNVLIDGVDLTSLNLKWLRGNIGVVGQEPALFDFSIRENILLAKPDATEEEIWEACTEANAASFISKLPKKLDTEVGEAGTQLSGGQKQRIAIARALLRNPKILLLDEATSALDVESEKVVQEALDKVSAGRTTVIVAHRLSTIRNADIIYVFDKGSVKETGTHDELINLKGIYYNLVMQQMTKANADENNGNPAAEKKLRQQLSITSDKSNEVVYIDEKKKEEKESINYFSVFGKLLKLNKPEMIYLIFGVLFSTAFGLVNIAFAILFGDVFAVFAVQDLEKRMHKTEGYAIQYCLIAVYTFFSLFLSGLFFAIAGQRLTERVRNKMFHAMLHQEIGWFDAKENNSGSLCARLSDNASKVQTATGTKVGQIFQVISALAGGFGMSMFYDWKIGLVANAFVPILVIGMIYQMILFTKETSVQKKALEKGAKIALDGINNIRTVYGLTCESIFVDNFTKELLVPHKKTMRNSHVRGFIYGFANSTFTFAYASVFTYGVHVYTEKYSFEENKITDLWKIAVGVLSGAMMAGMSISFLMDFGEVFESANSVFKLLERKPKISSDSSTGLVTPITNGHVEVEDADFYYPTRENTQVLRQFCIDIKSGKNVALVGQSGCGKSTVIQLIQRMYDPLEGAVKIENSDLRNLNLPHVRSKLGNLFFIFNIQLS